MAATVCMMIETKFAGPTDHRGARVIARNVNTGKRKVVPWDHALAPDQNHETAATVLRDSLVEGKAHAVFVSSVEGGGYIFAFPF